MLRLRCLPFFKTNNVERNQANRKLVEIQLVKVIQQSSVENSKRNWTEHYVLLIEICGSF
ncbi:hypothetical protein BLOT_000526 [Blomia tropicalis]|nr:hypothetical protein BLOT_000526 [Blomia tropicalis]